MLTDRIATWLRHWESGSGTGASAFGSVLLSTDVGLTRSENQDRVAMMRVQSSVSRKSYLVVAVADGMGGMQDGLGCATRALGSFFEIVSTLHESEPEDLLQHAAAHANREVYRLYEAKGGSTLSAVLIDTEGTLTILNVGDSRVYARTNEKAASVIRLTTDDNLEEAVGGTGRELLQFIGMGSGIRPHIKKLNSNISRLLISTDGVHYISQDVLKDIIASCPDLVDASKQLLTYSRWRGSPDNASLALINIGRAVDELRIPGPPGISITDPFGTLEIAETNQTKRSDIASQQEYAKNIGRLQPIAKRLRRTRLAVDKKKDERPNDQLSIEIDVVPNKENTGDNQ